MSKILEELRQQQEAELHPDFPNAPVGWTKKEAARIAADLGIEMTDEHWDVVRALQDYYEAHENDVVIHAHEVMQYLEDRFKDRGGRKKLYLLFPKGPITEGSLVAGVKPAEGSVDPSFGSVM
jgi:tRNA 2-thiouridine synthesizing protein E